jgi:acetyl-CoA carboxylase biotin carboxyl carrier protein
MARIDVESEVTGNVWKIEKQIGDHVEEEDVIMILESMKMEIPVEAPAAGTVVELKVKEEDQVDEDQVVAIIDTSSTETSN